MLVINGLTVNVEINIPSGDADKFDIDAVKAEIIRQVENGFLQQLVRFPHFSLPPEVQVNRIQANQHINPDQHISTEFPESSDPPYQPKTNWNKALKWGEADGQALQTDYELHEYQCIDNIYIPGTGSSYRSNRVIVNGNEIKMPDYLFLLFFRLVAELKKGNGGWVNIHSLAEDSIISDVQKYQIYGNLRTAVQGSLMGKDGRKFIQSNGSKNYRISTHPDLVGYDKTKLLLHSSPTVRRLAGELPGD